MGSKKQPEKRVRLTMEEKVQMHDFRERNSKMSYDAIAKIFTEKFGKKVTSDRTAKRQWSRKREKKEKNRNHWFLC